MTSNEFKNGMTIEFDGKLLKILEFMHVKPGKGNTFIRTKVRDMRTGGVLEMRINAGIKIEQAILDKQEMQYLYADGDNHIFMNTETYEQVEIPASHIEEELHFLIPNMLVNVTFYKGELLGVDLPDKVVLEITECDPAVAGDTKTNATKDATLETGWTIKGPLFIEQGERVIVSTESGEYVSREK